MEVAGGIPPSYDSTSAGSCSFVLPRRLSGSDKNTLSMCLSSSYLPRILFFLGALSSQEIDFEEGLLKMQGEEHEDALLLDSQHEPSKKPVIKSGSTMARLDRENDRASSQTSSSKSIEEVELVEEPSDRYPNNESGRLGAQEG